MVSVSDSSMGGSMGTRLGDPKSDHRRVQIWRSQYRYTGYPPTGSQDGVLAVLCTRSTGYPGGRSKGMYDGTLSPIPVSGTTGDNTPTSIHRARDGSVNGPPSDVDEWMVGSSKDRHANQHL